MRKQKLIQTMVIGAALVLGMQYASAEADMELGVKTLTLAQAREAMPHGVFDESLLKDRSNKTLTFSDGTTITAQRLAPGKFIDPSAGDPAFKVIFAREAGAHVLVKAQRMMDCRYNIPIFWAPVKEGQKIYVFNFQNCTRMV